MTVEKIEPRTKRAVAEASAPHVYQAIADAMGRLAQEGIGKNQKNQKQGYNFRGIDDVYNALALTLADARLCVLPRVVSREVTERRSKEGGVLFSVIVNTEFDFVSAIDGSKHTVGPFPGEAMDSGDKATNKAMSAAYKYMALETFCIPTEGDNDADATTYEVAPSAAGGAPASPPPRQQPTVRAAAMPFIEGSCAALEAAAGDLDAVLTAWDDIKGKPGWKQINEAERKLIEAAKAKAMPDDR